MADFKITDGGKTFIIRGAPDQETAMAEYQRQKGAAPASAPAAPAAPADPYDGLTRSQYEVRGLGRSAASGLTLGFNDEIEAYLRSKLGSEDYDTLLGRIRDQQKDFGGKYPVSSTVAEVAGGAAPILATGGIAAPAALPEAAAAGARALAFGGRVARGVGEGAAYGAGYGFGTGEGGLENRAKGAAGGAAVGGVLGGAAVPLAEGVAKFGQTAVAPIARVVTGRANEQAARDLSGAIASDRALADHTGARLPLAPLNDAQYAVAERAGFPVTPLEAGGARTLGMAEAAYARSPEAEYMLRNNLDRRHENQFDRASTLIDSMTPGGSSAERREAIVRAGRARSNQEYAQAYAHPNATNMYNEGFEQFMQSPIFQKAMNKALSTSQDEAALAGANVVLPKFVYKDMGNGTKRLTWAPEQGNPTPSLPFWNEVKKGLDSVIDEGTDPITRRANNEARLAGRLKNNMLDYIDTMVPQYRVAREGAGRYLGEENASKLGEKLYLQGNKLSQGDIQLRLRGLTPAEREEAALSYLDKMKTDLGSKAKEPGVGKEIPDISGKVFHGGDRNSVAAARMILGDQRANDLQAWSMLESMMAGKRHRIVGNSRTAARQLGDALLKPGAGAAAGVGLQGYETHDFNPLHPEVAMSAIGGAAIGAGGHLMRDRMAQEIARLITETAPQDLPKVINQLSSNPRAMALLRLLKAPLTAQAGQTGSPF